MLRKWGLRQIEIIFQNFDFFFIYFESPFFKALEIIFIIFQLDLLIILFAIKTSHKFENDFRGSFHYRNDYW